VSRLLGKAGFPNAGVTVASGRRAFGQHPTHRW
jgi:hypothetical protein